MSGEKDLYEEMVERFSVRPEKPASYRARPTKEETEEDESKAEFIASRGLDKKCEPTKIKLTTGHDSELSIDGEVSSLNIINVTPLLEEKQEEILTPTLTEPEEKKESVREIIRGTPIKSRTSRSRIAPSGPTPSLYEMKDYLDARYASGDKNKFVLSMWRKQGRYTTNMAKRITDMMRDEPLELIKSKLELYSKLDYYHDRAIQKQENATSELVWNDCEKAISIIGYYNKKFSLTNKQYNFLVVLITRLGL